MLQSASLAHAWMFPLYSFSVPAHDEIDRLPTKAGFCPIRKTFLHEPKHSMSWTMSYVTPAARVLTSRSTSSAYWYWNIVKTMHCLNFALHLCGSICSRI
jgi:hypothetical protein